MGRMKELYLQAQELEMDLDDFLDLHRSYADDRRKERREQQLLDDWVTSLEQEHQRDRTST